MAFGDLLQRSIPHISLGTTGIWTDGTDLYYATYNPVTDAGGISADRLSSGAAIAGLGVPTNSLAGNAHPTGIWSNGTTMWAADPDDDKIYAYTLSTRRVRDESNDFNTLDTDNTSAEGIWSNGRTMWVADREAGKIFAYNMRTKAREVGNDFNTLAGTGDVRGIWSNGTIMWAADATDNKIYAYNLSTKARHVSADITFVQVNGQGSPYGITGHNNVLYVSGPGFAVIQQYDIANPVADPTIDTFLVTPDIEAANGADVTLTWTTSDATGVTLNGSTVAVDGRQVISGKTDTTTDYVLVATNSAGITVTETITVTWGSLLDFGVRKPALDFAPLASDNTFASDIWSDDETMWVLDSNDEKIYAYNLSTKARDSAKDFNTLTVDRNSHPSGIWSDGVTMWVSQGGNRSDSTYAIYAYNLSTKARDSAKDFTRLASGVGGPSGLWSDGVTMWVADDAGDSIDAYNLSTKARDSAKDFTRQTLSGAGNNNPVGIWSDGTTMWVSDRSDDRLYAYSLRNRTRDASKDFNTLRAAGNTNPTGIWSDGVTMWVADDGGTRFNNANIYAYQLQPLTPTIESFTVDNATPSATQDITLTWDTFAATEVTLDGSAVERNGSLVISGKTDTTETYTLVATRGRIRVTQTVTVTWAALPTIDTFTASETMQLIGRNITLSWTTTGATTVTLDDSSVAVDGNQVVTESGAERTITYTLTASDGFNPPITRTVRIEWIIITVESFTATSAFDSAPGTITEHLTGVPIRLRWVTRGATTATIDGSPADRFTPVGGQDNPLFRGGRHEVKHDTAGEVIYTLVVSRGTVSVSATLTMTWLATAVVINNLSASPSTRVPVGSPIIIDYSLENVAEVVFTTTNPAITEPTGFSDVLSATASTSFSRTITLTINTASTLTYYLVGRRPGVPDIVQIIDLEWDTQEINSFTATPAMPQAGDAVEIDWETWGATRITLNGEEVGEFGPITITEPNPTTREFVLVASLSVVEQRQGRPVRVDFPDVTQTLTVRWATAPSSIDTFTASTLNPTEGDTVTLTWATTHATTVTLDGAAVDLDGMQGVTVASVTEPTEKTYTLVADNADHASVTETVTITWHPTPTIDSFRASDTTPHLGDEVKLFWATTGATEVTLNGSETDDVDETIGLILPVQNTGTTIDYTLVASNDGRATATQTIRIVWTDQRPTIVDVSASPVSASSEAHIGTAVTISWNITGATNNRVMLSIDGAAAAAVAAVSTQTVTKSTAGESVTYAFTATNENGSRSESITVTWRDFQPVINSFTTDLRRVHLNLPATLTWDTSNITSVTLNNLPVPAMGSSKETSATAATRSYDLVALNEWATGQTNRATARLIIVWLDLTPVVLFQVNNPTPDIGEVITLSWNVQNAVNVKVETLTATEVDPPEPPVLPPYKPINEGFRGTLKAFVDAYAAWRMASVPYGPGVTGRIDGASDELTALEDIMQTIITQMESAFD